MASSVKIPTLLCHSSPTKPQISDSNPRICFLVNFPPNKTLSSNIALSPLSTSAPLQRNTKLDIHFSSKAGSSFPVVSSEYMEEPETKVKFQTSLSLPGCSFPLSLLGTGYREKVFAIIGVKVYAAGLYANPSIFSNLDAWKGRTAAEVQQDSSLFDAIFHASLEKSLHIILVRDIDGKIFWDALDEAISPRIKSPTPIDESALSTFRNTFQERPLKKGTSIFLTWLDATKMLVCISSEGRPFAVDATIESSNVTSALFDVFLGGNPVSPSLKTSVSNGLAAALE